MTANPTFALVAGEASGDQLGAALIGRLKETYPGAKFVGIGGSAMRAAGMEAWWDSEQLAVFGLFEVLAHLPRLLGVRRAMRRKLLSLRPTAFIGIDAPDFNLRLEAQLKLAGICTIHYVSPTVWAWRAYRVHKIGQAADLVLCLFPFEPDFYREHGIAAAYVGHPLAEQIPLYTDSAAARRELGLDEAKPVIALLPGSRVGEVSRLTVPMIEAAALLSEEHQGLEFVAAMANQRVGEIFRNALSGRKGQRILVVDGRARTVMAAASVVICASGTATLETMLINRPLVVVYRLAEATFQLAKSLRLVRTKFVSLPNILAGKPLVPELIQHEATGKRIAAETVRWLRDECARRQIEEDFNALHHKLQCDASQRAAGAITDLLQARS